MNSRVARRHARDLSRIRAEIARTDPCDVRRRVLLVCAHERLRRRADAHREQSRPAATPSVLAPTTSDRRRRFLEYTALVKRICTIAAEVLPSNARVLVVSRGDDALLAIGSLDTGHFPQARGEWAGYYPETGADVVAHLESLQDDGYDHILFPATSFWWLEYYERLAARLLTKGRVLWHDESCAIFSLQSQVEVGGS